ncbi:MAG: hypothetical protein ACOCUR_00615, partial [Nanoarchaeota archaeon]
TQWKFWIYGPKTEALDVGGKEKYEARSVKHWRPHPYDGFFSEVRENSDLDGIIEGYVLDVSRPPASLLTIFRNGDDLYSRFFSSRDMKLTDKGYSGLVAGANFIPENRKLALEPNMVSFMLDSNNIITGTLNYVLDSLEEYVNSNVKSLNKKDSLYVTKEIERSYMPLRKY